MARDNTDRVVTVSEELKAFLSGTSSKAARDAVTGNFNGPVDPTDKAS